MRSKNCSAPSSSDDKTSSWIFQAEGEERVERRHWRLKGQKDLNGIGGTSPSSGAREASPRAEDN